MNILKAAAFLKSARSRQKAGGEARGRRQEAGGRRELILVLLIEVILPMGTAVLQPRG